MKLVRKMFADKEGATAIEYGLIAALIAIAAITAMGQVGDRLSALFGAIAAALTIR
jgi:pilus assembly protein Flp/PilA